MLALTNWKLMVSELIQLEGSTRVSLQDTIMKLLDLMQDSRATGRNHLAQHLGRKIHTKPATFTDIQIYISAAKNIQNVSATFCTCTRNGRDD